MDSVGVEDTAEQLNRLIDIGETMARKYWVTVTNPPYMSISNGDSMLNEYVRKYYNDNKADLFAVCLLILVEVSLSTECLHPCSERSLYHQ